MGQPPSLTQAMEGGWGRERGEGKAQGIEKVEGTDDRTLRSTNGVIYPLRSAR